MIKFELESQSVHSCIFECWEYCGRLKSTSSYGNHTLKRLMLHTWLASLVACVYSFSFSLGCLMLAARLVRAHLDFCTSWCLYTSWGQTADAIHMAMSEASRVYTRLRGKLALLVAVCIAIRGWYTRLAWLQLILTLTLSLTLATASHVSIWLAVCIDTFMWTSPTTHPKLTYPAVLFLCNSWATCNIMQSHGLFAIAKLLVHSLYCSTMMIVWR